MATKKTEENIEELKEENPMRPVKVHLFKDGGKYKDDVVAGLNGRVWKIKRGVDVEIPYAVAMVLERHRALQEQAADFIMKEEQNFREAEKNLS